MNLRQVMPIEYGIRAKVGGDIVRNALTNWTPCWGVVVPSGRFAGRAPEAGAPAPPRNCGSGPLQPGIFFRAQTAAWPVEQRGRNSQKSLRLDACRVHESLLRQFRLCRIADIRIAEIADVDSDAFRGRG